MADQDNTILYNLRNGSVLIIDQDDVDFLKFTWGTRWGYAVRNAKDTGKQRTAMLHRDIYARVIGRNLLKSEQIDHINGNRLDNRRCNLRIATHAQNCQNTGVRARNKVGLKGVSKVSKSRKRPWRARIFVNGKEVCLGYTATPEEAHDLYIEAAKKYFGEFACTDRIAQSD